MTDKNYSIDLETLGTRYDSYILSIGVSEFDINTGDILSEFHRKVTCNDNFDIDLSTVMWWINQSEAARNAISDRGLAIPIQIALEELHSFMPFIKNNTVWGNGSSFDITLLDHAHHKCNLKQPWEYWNVCDMRTIVRVATACGFNKKSIEFEGTQHDALADASHQARVISAAYNHLTFPH